MFLGLSFFWEQKVTLKWRGGGLILKNLQHEEDLAIVLRAFDNELDRLTVIHNHKYPNHHSRVGYAN